MRLNFELREGGVGQLIERRCRCGGEVVHPRGKGPAYSKALRCTSCDRQWSWVMWCLDKPGELMS